ncbi:apelin receptor early endogenous ligand [Plectropomus leopardus]|uniref:apelin receptor early endogenous ligand n=1 Tax=Plectropomus leopardus TaxID=160734 RepID=UPI001C4D6BC5|nr:apelin receptor early endogenous ligand [Plectropomus leopardus]
MRIFNLFYLVLLLVAALAPVYSARQGKHPQISPVQMSRQLAIHKRQLNSPGRKLNPRPKQRFISMRVARRTADFLNLRRKYHRHHCPHRRCLPLHSRVPFP